MRVTYETTQNRPPYLVLPGNRRIAVCGLAELPGYIADDVSHVVSLIDPGLSFERIDGSRHLSLRMHDIDEYLPGHSAPTAADAESVLAFVQGMRDLAGGFSLVIHCHAGISRSSATAIAAMLVLEDRFDPETAVAALLKHRPMMWPNALLTGHYDRALGLDGSLIEAVRLYRRAAFDTDWSED